MVLFICTALAMALIDGSGSVSPVFVAVIGVLAAEAWCLRNFLFVVYASRIFQLGNQPRLAFILRLARWWIVAIALFICLGSATWATAIWSRAPGTGVMSLIGGMYLFTLPWILIGWPTILTLIAVALTRIKRRVSEHPPIIQLESPPPATETSPE